MTILWAIIAGLVIGLLARLVLPGRQPIPLWATVVIGIIGGLIGNGLAAAFNVAHTSGVDWVRHGFQVGVAAILIALVTPLWAGRRRV
jgi:uncharacterized membrane protein YeaQ/YmgE (transglycosylase-associated protein family)